ncbi:septum formation initiator family protein [Niallia sp. XMNu-256]|uniref:FtsB family cell division protein n=1 Tax=Niallia sp. XMNu-256 TaxID=3082444 RepID=UPI0030D0CBE7
MGDNKKDNITKIQTNYALQHEEGQISVARRKKLLYRRLTAFFVLVAIVTYIMVSTLISQTSTIAEKKEEQEKVKQELASLKQEEILLKEEIVKLNDDDYIAKLARKEYFLSDENEIIFTLPREKEKEKGKEEEEKEEEEKSSR